MSGNVRTVSTTRFGLLEVGDDAMVRFPKGIPAFEDHTEWAFVGEDDSPVKWLQSLKDGDVALPVCPPHLILPSYQAKLTADDLKIIEASSEDELGIMVVLTIPGNVAEMTANLRAPLIFNYIKQLGCQVILSNEEYSVRHRVFAPGVPEASPCGGGEGS
ncbi:protein of unknown function DUF180 [Thermanaerovibrio acidaminovorans DSM 6589]|jgi:flagellar assembly factor FliW|uniref:Flagellar assembly factor FliW n=2 Tax=Thermanaerovibrio TaxID=81461 RepID=D1B9F0_THEAS|nr:protein of unknown function DUF180 [Thermanaerovibrio acidaminovorans DSM 6589]